MTTQEQTNDTDLIVEPADNELDTQTQDQEATQGRYRDPETGKFAKRPEEDRPVLEHRDDPRERIAEAFAKARKEADAQVEEEEPTARIRTEEEKAAEEAGLGQEEPGPGSAEPAKAEEAPKGPVPLSIVVDGQMYQVDRNDPRWSAEGMTDDMVRASAQMFWATQARLQQANQYLDKSKGTDAKPADQSASAPSPEPDAAAGQGETKLSPDQIGEIVDKLQLGNRDEAVEALHGLIQSLGQPQQEAQDIGQVVQAALVQRENQNEIDRAISAFEKENADIANDKYLSQVVLDIAVDTMKEDMKRLGVTDELLAPNGRPLAPRMVAQIYRNMRVGGLPVKTHAEVLSDSVGRLRQTFNLPRSTKPTEADQATAQARIAQKRQMQQQPRSAGVKTTQGQPRPMTAAEIVRQERRRRMPWLG